MIIYILPGENSQVILLSEKSKSKNDVYNMMPYGFLKIISYNDTNSSKIFHK